MTATNVTPLMTEAEAAPEIDRPCFRVYDRSLTTKTGQKRRAGVYWHGQRQGKGDAPPADYDQWICSPL
ncbi:RNA helicase, partial [Azotobacter beijerinckii]|nr:RNA helicase [Azotobacter beijerinckii]